MTIAARRRIVSLVTGLLFGAGLALSGMTLPEKVTGFLDVTGNWDPSLAFVMMGAIGVHFFAVRRALKKSAPYCGTEFQLPKKKQLDPRLITGAALFGIGWGIAGICPGPGLVNLLTGAPGALAFVGAMLVGMAIEHAVLEGRGAKQATPAPAPGAAGQAV